jgi:hypothetical protein
VSAITLEYHDVIDGADFDASGFPGPSSASYKLPLSDFEQHVRTVVERCRIAVPPEAFEATEPEAVPRAVLTFDDGGVSAHSVIAPLLESLGARASGSRGGPHNRSSPEKHRARRCASCTSAAT